MSSSRLHARYRTRWGPHWVRREVLRLQEREAPVILLVVVLVSVNAFLAWVCYDCGFDSGYNRAWNDTHPRRTDDGTTPENL